MRVRLTEILFKYGVPIPVVDPLRMVLLLYGLLVVRRCMSRCSMIITPPMNVLSLLSCEAWNWFDVECKCIVSNWMLTCGSL